MLDYLDFMDILGFQKLSNADKIDIFSKGNFTIREFNKRLKLNREIFPNQFDFTIREFNKRLKPTIAKKLCFFDFTIREFNKRLKLIASVFAEVFGF